VRHPTLVSAEDGAVNEEAPDRDDLATELDRLRAENARLRELLGLDQREADGHASTWSPMLLPDLPSSPSIDNTAPNAAKLALYASLFGTRSDVYATRWENASTGKAGWSPATKGGWSRQRTSRDYLPLTDEVFASHLRGGASVGIYPLLRRDTCMLLVCDFDKGTWALDALAYLDACHANGVPAALERSRSGNGGHVCVFFDSQVPATQARAMGAALLRMSPAAVTELAATLRPIDAGPTLSLVELARQGGPPPPAVIQARLGAMLSIERAGLPPAVIAALKHLGSIANPEFYEKQRMRFSTWDTPRFISCYGGDLEWLHLPRGLTERVTELVASLDSRLELADDRVDPPSIDLTFAGTLRPQQAAAVADLVGHDRGVLVAPPGAGKTVMACAVIAHHRTPTLVVVDRKELVDQWRSRLVEHLGLRPQEIGQIGGGKDKPTGVVDVAMLQSLARRDDATIFERYGLVVVDECHHLPAVSFAACVQRARSRRWLGLTATPYRRDKLEAIIAFHCGPTRHEIKPGTVAGAELVRRELVVHQTSTEVSEHDAAHIQSVFAALVADERRTAQICADVHAATSSGRTCLVLTQRTDHIEAIVDGLGELGDTALVLKGGLGKKARAAVSDAITSRPADAGIVLVATGSYLGEGFDWPELDTLFLAFPLAFKGRVVQYVGRLLRTHEGKHNVELHDYVDIRIPVIDRMHAKRLPAYATLGFDIPKLGRRRPAPSPRTSDPSDPF